LAATTGFGLSVTTWRPTLHSQRISVRVRPRSPAAYRCEAPMGGCLYKTLLDLFFLLQISL
jgi:hypothetical protein